MLLKPPDCCVIISCRLIGNICCLGFIVSLHFLRFNTLLRKKIQAGKLGNDPLHEECSATKWQSSSPLQSWAGHIDVLEVIVKRFYLLTLVVSLKPNLCLLDSLELNQINLLATGKSIMNDSMWSVDLFTDQTRCMYDVCSVIIALNQLIMSKLWLLDKGEMSVSLKQTCWSSLHSFIQQKHHEISKTI